MLLLTIWITSSRRFSKFRPWAELQDPEGVGPGGKIGQKFFSDFFTFFNQNDRIDIFTDRLAPKYKKYEQILVNFRIF